MVFVEMFGQELITWITQASIPFPGTSDIVTVTVEWYQIQLQQETTMEPTPRKLVKAMLIVQKLYMLSFSSSDLMHVHIDSAITTNPLYAVLLRAFHEETLNVYAVANLLTPGLQYLHVLYTKRLHHNSVEFLHS